MSLMIEELDGVQRNLERTVVERTKQLRAREAELQAQNMRLDAALSNMSQGLVMFDAEARLVICNQRFISMYRYDPDEIRPGMSLREFIRLARPTAPLRASPRPMPDDCTRNQCRPANSHFSSWTTVARSRLRQRHAGGGWVATHEDITERRQAEIKIAHMARHDALTDLPNRVLLRERLERGAGPGRARSQACGALSRSRHVQERQ